MWQHQFLVLHKLAHPAPADAKTGKRRNCLTFQAPWCATQSAVASFASPLWIPPIKFLKTSVLRAGEANRALVSPELPPSVLFPPLPASEVTVCLQDASQWGVCYVQGSGVCNRWIRCAHREMATPKLTRLMWMYSFGLDWVEFHNRRVSVAMLVAA